MVAVPLYPRTDRRIERNKGVFDLLEIATRFKNDEKVDVEFDCTFTGPEGKPYTAHMKVTKVDGDDVYFEIQSRPS